MRLACWPDPGTCASVRCGRWNSAIPTLHLFRWSLSKVMRTNRIQPFFDITKLTPGSSREVWQPATVPPLKPCSLHAHQVCPVDSIDLMSMTPSQRRMWQGEYSHGVGSSVARERRTKSAGIFVFSVFSAVK